MRRTRSWAVLALLLPWAAGSEEVTEPPFYALGTGGTLLFPEADGTLRPGAFASVGLGVDNAR